MMMLPGKKQNYHIMASGKLLNPVFAVRQVGESGDAGMIKYPAKCIRQSKAWSHEREDFEI